MTSALCPSKMEKGCAGIGGAVVGGVGERWLGRADSPGSLGDTAEGGAMEAGIPGLGSGKGN